jgi:hypothetical protein
MSVRLLLALGLAQPWRCAGSCCCDEFGGTFVTKVKAGPMRPAGAW